MALFPVSAQSAHGGGYAGGARHHRFASDDPAVGREIRQAFANNIRRRSVSRLGDKWHLDEVVVTVRGKKQWLWRAVDQDGFVLDVLVQSRRDAKAAKRLMRKLLKRQGHTPRVMITDKL